jgi:hypothetical protein
MRQDAISDCLKPKELSVYAVGRHDLVDGRAREHMQICTLCQDDVRTMNDSWQAFEDRHVSFEYMIALVNGAGSEEKKQALIERACDHLPTCPDCEALCYLAHAVSKDESLINDVDFNEAMDFHGDNLLNLYAKEIDVSRFPRVVLLVDSINLASLKLKPFGLT